VKRATPKTSKSIDEGLLERALLGKVNDLVAELCETRKTINLMEVCGTHTMAISGFGIRRAVDQRLRLLSGPGCPVCVTDQAEIDAAIGIAQGDLGHNPSLGLGHGPKSPDGDSPRRAGTRRNPVQSPRFRSCPAPVVVTFGDMIRVPGSRTSLEQEKAKGADVRVVYSALDALRLAQDAPGREFVFLGVGFETTAPTVAATVLAAQESGVRNFFVLPMFKTIPPALEVIASSKRVNVDGFILPGHVSTIIGTRPYEFLRDKCRLPSCVVGFEALDVLQGIHMLLRQMQTGPLVEIQYKRSVRPEGNEKAQQVMDTVLEPCDAVWRGIGTIPGSGLTLRREFAEFDARKRFRIVHRSSSIVHRSSPCRCGDVMLGLIVPPECKLFAKACTPESPVGPCMVSTEGACAAYFKYDRN
jgi:hydrogenase expression/formation protein HypD